MSFYITLPSDSSLNYFPDNTLSKFRAYLPEIVQLNGPYEVGLAEISYPRTWNNIKKEQVVQVWTDKIMTEDLRKQKIAIIPKANFSLIEDLMELLKFEGKILEFVYHRLMKRVSIRLKKDFFCKIPSDIAIMLGFTLKREDIEIKHSMLAPYTVDVDAGLHSLFVYSDIVENTIVGDRNVPLLRIISVKGKDGETTDAIFSQPHYLPVAGSNIQIIEINIMDDLGNPVQFERGKVHATLHFRPRREWSLL